MSAIAHRRVQSLPKHDTWAKFNGGCADLKIVKKSLHLKKVEVEKTIKIYWLVKKSLTLDNWTSAANENYAALTLQTILDFQLK